MPTAGLKGVGDAAIALPIPREFHLPEDRIAFRSEIAVAAMTVPKATIYEHCNALVTPNKVGLSQHGDIPPPAC